MNMRGDHVMDNNEVFTFDIERIRRSQKNKYPLLFIDKVIEAVLGKYAKAIKNFTFNGWFFPFRNEHLYSVPTFVLTESLEQTFLMTFLSLDEYMGVTTSTIGMDNVSLKQPVFPGNTLVINAVLNSFRRGIAKGHVDGYVDNINVASLDVMVAVNFVLERFKPKG